MHVSLDQALGRQPRLNRVGQSLLNIGSGASAAYSLRSLTGGEPKAVRIRRDGDNEERDFTTAEIVNEAADWTNGKQETTLPADVATSAAAYSLRKVKSDYTGHAVRIRREFDDVEVNVSFDTNDEVSTSSPIENTTEQGGESGSTTANTLNEFITEDVLHYESDFTSGTNSYLTQSGSVTLSAPSGSFNGEEDYLLATCSSDATLFLQRNIPVSSGDTYRVDFKVFIPTANNDNTPFLNNTGSNTSDSVTVTKGSWQDVSITLALNSSQNRLPRIIFSMLAGEVLYFKDIKYTVTSGANAAVHTWYDQSGSSKNATQISDDNQPLIAQNGSFLADGITFDGTDDVLSYLDSGTTDDASIFTVNTRGTSTDNTSRTAGYKGSADSSKLTFAQANDNTLRFDGAASSTGSLTLPASGLYLRSSFKTLTTAKDFINGGLNIDESITLGVTTKQYSIGAVQANGVVAFDGSVKEVIIYNTDQTANRFKIESNINNHYGILDGTSLSSSTAFFLDETAGTGSPSSFTADGLDGFTMIMGGQGNVRAGIELQNTVPSGKHVVVSFDADLTLGTGTASPIIKLMRTSLSGLGGGNNFEIIQGRNTISLNSNNNDSKFVLFLEGNSNVGYSISNFTMSLRDENGFVNKWYDQSGNSNDATAAADTNEPKIVSAGSYPGELEFDGSNDVLEFTTAEVAASDKISVFMTLTGPSSGDKSLLGSSIAFPIRRFSGSNKLASLTNAGLHRLDSTSNFTDTNTGIITLIRDLAVPSGLLAVDGTVEDTVSTSYGLSSTYQIGAKLSGSSNGRFADIKCKEMIVYATNQTTNRTAIETNIANEYGITLS